MYLCIRVCVHIYIYICVYVCIYIYIYIVAKLVSLQVVVFERARIKQQSPDWNTDRSYHITR